MPTNEYATSVIDHRFSRAPGDLPAYDDLLDLEMRNGVLDDTRGVQVICMDRIRNITVHEDLARLARGDGSLWDARIGAAYPPIHSISEPTSAHEYPSGYRIQDFRRLALRKIDESVRIPFGCALRILHGNKSQHTYILVRLSDDKRDWCA